MIYLASQSPRRAELLQQIGVPFEQFAVDIDESHRDGERPEDLVQRLALEKARTGFPRIRAEDASALVLGSDTIVVHNGRILGKPADSQDAHNMLRDLSATQHQVLTAVALVGAELAEVRMSINNVSFRELSDGEITLYIATGEPMDKAGAYGIQGAGAVFVQHLEGSYSAVMGLPLFETAGLLRQAGVKYWQYNDITADHR